MKRFTFRQLILCCGLSVAFTVGFGVLIRVMQWQLVMDHVLAKLHPRLPALLGEQQPDARPLFEDWFIDQNAYLLEKDAYYRDLPPQDLQEMRLAQQAKLLKTYEEDPAGFLDEYNGIWRTWLFDAVVDGKNLLRVGRSGDGGKWVSDPQSLRPGAVVYSVGVGTDISFDVEMAGLFGCEVHTFDPSPSVERSFSDYHPGQPVGKGKFWYHPVGLGPISTDPATADELIIEDRRCPVKCLSELAAELGHDRVDILKIDIEGGEMAALKEVLSSRVLERLSVEQLLVEFHFLDDEHWSSFVQILGLLREQGYLLFRKEFNLSNTSCAEFAFLRAE